MSLASFLKGIIIEIFCCLYIFSLQCRTSTFQNLLKDKSCLNELKENVTVCQNLSNYPMIENSVQRITTSYNMYYSLISTIPSIIAAIFLGTWSDKYGRKIPIIIAVVGTLMEVVGIILNSVHFNAPIFYTLLPAIPGGMTGGSMVILTACYSYISNISNASNRATRFNFINIVYTFAGPLGIALGGVLYKFRGTTSVFILSAAVLTGGLMLLLVLFEETDKEQFTHNRLTYKTLISLDNVKENVKACCKHREGKTRLEIWLIFVTNFLVNMSFMGTITVQFMFALKMYNWDNYYYSMVSMIISIVQGTAVLISVPVLSKVLKIHDAILALIGAFSLASQELIRSVAHEEWVYYVAAATGLVGAQVNVATRSRLSKLVKKDEIGKIFSVLALFESIPPLFGPVVFTLIYNSSLDYFPGLAYVCSACCLIIPVIAYMWIYAFSHVAPYENDEERDNSQVVHRDSINSDTLLID